MFTMLRNTLKNPGLKNIDKYANTVSYIFTHVDMTYNSHFSSWDVQCHNSVRLCVKACPVLTLLLGPHRIYMITHRQRQAYILTLMSSVFQAIFYYILFCTGALDWRTFRSYSTQIPFKTH